MWQLGIDNFKFKQHSKSLMKQKSGNRKSKSLTSIPDISISKSDYPDLPETPIKKQPALKQNSFYSKLSPLPFPPRIDNCNNELNNTYSNELRYVQTPVAKQHSKFLSIQEEEHIHGINSKIIFESSGEDVQNNSSSIDSSDQEEETPNSQQQSSEEEESEQCSSQHHHQHLQEFRENVAMGLEKENKSRNRNNKSRNQGTASKQTNPNKKVFCNCKKTKCLKLYCDCFRLNQTCQGCNCVGCHNLQIFSQERNNAILALMDRNPDPFGQKIEDDKHVKGCNCKKSNCLKKYCECYQAGLKCGQNCKCQECKNVVIQKNGPEGDRGGALAKNTAKKERKMVEM